MRRAATNVASGLHCALGCAERSPPWGTFCFAYWFWDRLASRSRTLLLILALLAWAVISPWKLVRLTAKRICDLSTGQSWNEGETFSFAHDAAYARIREMHREHSLVGRGKRL